MKRFSVLLLILLAIPAVGIATSYALQNRLDSQLSEALADSKDQDTRSLTMSDACAIPAVHTAISSSCDDKDTLELLGLVSALCGATALALLVAIALAALVARGSRFLLAAFFGVGRRVLLVVLGFLVLAQGAIAAYAVYELELTYIGRIHPFIIFAVAAGALIGGLKIFASGFALARRPRMAELAFAVTQDEQPQLWKFILEIATRLSARPPTNVILALDTSFYATAADVVVLNTDKALSGETLCLSLPFLRVLTTQEIAGIIGHELGHFSGQDTAYTLKFVPIYSDLGRAIQAAAKHEGSSGLALVPAIALMGFFLERFAHAERAIGRKREAEADQAGAKAAGVEALASALMKVALLSPTWAIEGDHMVEALKGGKVLVNGPLQFANIARVQLQGIEPTKLAEAVASYRMPHPTDTHPLLSQRLRALNVHPSEAAAHVTIPREGAITLVANAEKIEEALTEVQAQLLIKNGVVEVSEGAPSAARDCA